MSTIQINGVTTEVPVGALAYKHADPTEGARWVRDEQDLAAIRNEDESLLVMVTPPIEVIGLGEAFDLPDDCESDADMEWYGTVRVSIDGAEYEVGAVIGVPESERGTCRAAGSGVRPFLSAWYADSSDWSAADVPQELCSAVIAEIAGAAGRLWAERS